jgi:hypothetical protein
MLWILPWHTNRLVTDMELELTRYQQKEQRYDQPQLSRQQIQQLVGRDSPEPHARRPGIGTGSKKCQSGTQGCGSGSDWIRIRIPWLCGSRSALGIRIRIGNPDPGSGSKIKKMKKNKYPVLSQLILFIFITDPDWIWIRIELNCWIRIRMWIRIRIRIRIESIRIHNPMYSTSISKITGVVDLYHVVFLKCCS